MFGGCCSNPDETMFRMRNSVADDKVELLDEHSLRVRYRLRNCGKTRVLITAIVVLLVISVIVGAIILRFKSKGTKRAPCGKPSSGPQNNKSSQEPQNNKTSHDKEPQNNKTAHGKADGGYSQWGFWSACSVSCGKGHRIRHRTCTSPPPSTGGKDCFQLGPYYETKNCSAGSCTVDGGYSQWGYWSLCSMSCGEGRRVRYRTCTSPPPSIGGKHCFQLGPYYESESCSAGSCPGPLICKTAECYKISKVISNQIDTSKDPCDDFYAYACGGFIKTHQLIENQSYIGGFTIVNDDNMKVLQQAMVNASAKYNQSSSILKTVKIYGSCLNTSAIESRGSSPLENLIELYGGWSVTGKGLNSWTVPEKMGRVLRDLNVQTLLRASVGTDFEDSGQHILNLNIASLGMSFEYYFDQKARSIKVREAYKTYMKTIAKLLGGGSSSDFKMNAIYDFESGIAESVDPDTVSEDLIESLMEHHRSGRSLDDLDQTIEEFWLDSNFETSFVTKFLNSAFHNQGKTFSSFDKVYYPQSDVYKDVFKAMASQYQNKNKETVKDYIMWRVIDSYVMSMPDNFVQAKLKYLKAVTGLLAENKRWSNCLETMMSPMSFTLGRLYVDANFDESTKTTVKDMTTRLRQSFIDNLDDADWMDSSTKQSAKAKAQAIKEDIGYPLFIKHDKKLDKQYSLLSAGEDYFENTVSMNKLVVQKNFGMLREPVDKDMWMESPAQVNGYYSPQQNRIVFLAGILQSPFYRKYWPKYINYGSLAMVIGHEITHGFDSQGRLYDKDGNVKDWWSYSSTYNFEERAQCLVNQYNNYDVFGTSIDGKQTLNENIADNGGIKLAYDAYQSWVKDNKKEGQLPDLGLSVDKLFFIGFATPWCSVYKKEAALSQVASDVHSFPKYRVIGPLSNFKKFADAYSCKRGKGMDPSDKCSVW